MVKSQTVLVTALLLLVSGVAAQGADAEIQQDAETPESDLGEDVLAHNFVMRGLPASNQEEVEVERSFENEPGSDESFNLTEDEALGIALDELGSDEWNLEESEADDGIYEFEFVREDSEAEVSVDGSSGRIVEFEAEVEWEPENDEPSAVLSGFIQFSREGYEVDTDIDVDEENNEALFDVEIEGDDELGASVVTRKEIREFEDAAPGEYTGKLEVTRNDEVVHTEEQEFRVPGPIEDDSEESEDDDSEDESEETLEDLSRDELIDEVRSLREQVRTLREEINSDNSDRPDTPRGPPEGIGTPEDDENGDSEEDDSNEEENESEPEESESENESESTETPGSSDERPGFVDRMLSGIFN